MEEILLTIEKKLQISYSNMEKDEFQQSPLYYAQKLAVPWWNGK